MQKKLLSALNHRFISVPNRIVMAPMNRRRANIEGIPSESMITYYAQRTSAGLIITDNTLIAANGGEVLNTPALYNEKQINAWKRITDAVHANGGKVFVQLVHGGRVGHSLIQQGKPLIAPSAISVNETISVSDKSYQPMSEPVAILRHEIDTWVNAFEQAAINAVEAGFDGVEIHAAHGFLIDQFINPHSNHRTDDYGGSIENRSRFLLEIVQAVTSAIGKNKTGIRLSPFKEIYDLKTYPDEKETHQYILDELQKADILYVHFSNAVANTSVTVSDGGAGFWTSSAYNRGIYSNYVISGNYWKWREASLSYQLSDKWIQRSKYIKSVTLSVQGRNLFLWAPKSNEYTDPDYSANDNNAIGVSTTDQTPPTRYFGGTISITF